MGKKYGMFSAEGNAAVDAAIDRYGDDYEAIYEAVAEAGYPEVYDTIVREAIYALVDPAAKLDRVRAAMEAAEKEAIAAAAVYAKLESYARKAREDMEAAVAAATAARRVFVDADAAARVRALDGES